MNHPPIPPNSEFFKIENGKPYFVVHGTECTHSEWMQVRWLVNVHSTERTHGEWMQVRWLVTDIVSGAYWRTIIAAVAAEEWREIQIEARSRYSPNREISRAEYEKLLDEYEHNINAWREWGREKQ